MRLRRDSRWMAATSLSAAAAIAMLVTVSCSGSSDSSNDNGGGSLTSTHYGGVATSTTAGESGGIQLNIYNGILGASSRPSPLAAPGGISVLDRTLNSSTAPLANVTVQGSFFKNGGAGVTLDGLMDTATNAITLQGGGYQFAGTLQGTTVVGTYGLGAATGVGTYQAVKDDAGQVMSYCGSWLEDGTGNTGPWNFFVSGSSLNGTVVLSDGTVAPVVGTVDGNGGVTIAPAASPTTPIATGTISNGAASGQYNTGDSTGTWSGQTCQ